MGVNQGWGKSVKTISRQIIGPDVAGRGWSISHEFLFSVNGTIARSCMWCYRVMPLSARDVKTGFLKQPKRRQGNLSSSGKWFKATSRK